MKFLVEGYKAIEYKGYIIERDEDSLEQAIADAEENGRLEYDFIFRVIKNKKVLNQFNNLREARAFIDELAEEELQELKSVVYTSIDELMSITVDYSAGQPLQDVVADLTNPRSSNYNKKFKEMQKIKGKHNNQLEDLILEIVSANSDKWWYDPSEGAIWHNLQIDEELEDIIISCVYENMCECEKDYGVYADTIINDLQDDESDFYNPQFEDMPYKKLLTLIHNIVDEDDDYYWESIDDSIWHASE